MIRGELGLGILATGLWIYCLLDVVMADESRIRNLSKATWVMLVLVTSVVGAVAWLVAGRPQSPSRSLPYKGNTGYSEYDRPGRFVATDPAADELFLKQVRERAEAQRQEARIQRLAREQREERERQEIRDAHARRRLQPESGAPESGAPEPGAPGSGSPTTGSLESGPPGDETDPSAPGDLGRPG